MEPDAEMILAHKIRTVEKQPVSWNREGVWNTIKEEVAKSKKPYRVYYYAAAVIFLVVCSVFVVQQRLEKPDSEVIRIEPITQTVHPEIKTRVEIAEESTVSPIHNTPALNTNQFIAIENHEPVFEIEVPDDIQIETTIAQVVVEENETVQDSNIEPIIGRYEPTPKTETIAGTKRKRLLHTLESSEIKSGDDYTKAILIARIK